MPELRVGIAGLGSAGKRRLSAALAHPRVRVVATADTSVTPDELGHQGLVHHADVDDLLDRDDLDAVIVSLPNDLAGPSTLRARAQGLPVLCEKPPARDAAELRRVLGPGPVLRYGFNHRLHHGPAAAKERIPRLGALRSIVGVYQRAWLARPGDWRLDHARSGGGILLDQGIHLVDLVSWLAGPLELVSADASPSRVHPLLEDHVDAHLSAGGVPVHLRSSARGAPRFELTLVGARGTLRLVGLATSSSQYAPETLAATWDDGATEALEWRDDPSWQREMHGFVRHVLDGHDDGHGRPSEALAALELVDQLRAALPRPPTELRSAS